MHQEKQPEFKLCFKPERIYAKPNIAERNKGIGTSCEGVLNHRVGASVAAIRLIKPNATKRFKLRIASLNVGTMHGRRKNIFACLFSVHNKITLSISLQ